MNAAARTRLELLALTALALVAARVDSMSLLGLIGAVAAVVGTHSRARRRAAEAAAWGTFAAVAFIASANALDLDRRFSYLAPVVAGAVTILLKERTSRRRASRRTA